MPVAPDSSSAAEPSSPPQDLSSRSYFLLKSLRRRCTPFRYDASGHSCVQPEAPGAHLAREA
ncbi:MAG: hypothetical protein ACO4AU_03595 [bacterium]